MSSNSINGNRFLSLTTKKVITTPDGKKYQIEEEQSIFADTTATNPFDSSNLNITLTGDNGETIKNQQEIIKLITESEKTYNATTESLDDEEENQMREIGAEDDNSVGFYNEKTKYDSIDADGSLYEKYLKLFQKNVTVGGVPVSEINNEDSTNQVGGTDSDDKVGQTDGENKTDETDGMTEEQKKQKEAQEKAEKEYQEKYGIREDFDATAVATVIHDAMKGWGTDEDTVFKYLGTKGTDALNDAEIREVMDAYQEKYGEPMQEYIENDFNYSDKKQLLARLDVAENGISEKYAKMSDEEKLEVKKEYAGKLYDAMWRAGTDEQALFEVMQLDPSLRKDIIEYYDKSPYASKKTFKEKADRELSGGYQSKLDDLYDEAMNA